MLVEVVLNLLIGNVDAQLLKGVSLEVLKAKDIKNAYGETFIPEE